MGKLSPLEARTHFAYMHSGFWDYCAQCKEGGAGESPNYMKSMLHFHEATSDIFSNRLSSTSCSSLCAGHVEWFGFRWSSLENKKETGLSTYLGCASFLHLRAKCYINPLWLLYLIMGLLVPAPPPLALASPWGKHSSRKQQEMFQAGINSKDRWKRWEVASTKLMIRPKDFLPKSSWGLKALHPVLTAKLDRAGERETPLISKSAVWVCKTFLLEKKRTLSFLAFGSKGSRLWGASTQPTPMPTVGLKPEARLAFSTPLS